MIWGASAAGGGLDGLFRAADAQAVRAPEAGGRVASLGQPSLWRWQVGLGTGGYFKPPSTGVMTRAVAGAYHSPLNPVAKLTEIGVEAYVGAHGKRADAGIRAILRIPYLSSGIGSDYSLTGRRVDLLLTTHTPVRRGGFLTRGSMLRFDWYPALRHTFNIGVTAPLGDRLAGRSRPIQDYVDVARDVHTPVVAGSTKPAVNAALDSLRVSAEWIRRLVVPFLDQDGRSAAVAVARTASYLDTLRYHLEMRSVADEVRWFHERLEHAFAAAADDPAVGRTLARNCRAILLDDVLLPYDRLLGRKKRHDSLKEFAMVARGRFSRWMAMTGVVPPARVSDVAFVFQRVTEILEQVRKRAAKEWDDQRLVWLPLQYGLLPEEYDEQDELTALVERATQVQFTDHNRLSYVANLQFHWELLRMIQQTRSYHVLWIHDFPAITDDSLDDAALAQVVDGYLKTLADRVEAYDSAGQLPLFFIFLDQHYYEARRSRLLMTLLEDPLRATSRLPGVSPHDAARIDSALERLRVAVRHSTVLQAEARQYGNTWLHNRIKVHVNITNRVDPSFWSGGLISSLFGYPDDVMRDHRKLAFRDVDESEPFSGIGILTGMGVGENYLGPGWDDRSLILQGPVLLQLRQAARELLLSQGLVESELPLPLRDRRGTGRVLAPADATRFDTRAMALVNGTGFMQKSLNVAKAVLYSLLPRGSVIKIPDSLWNATFFGGLLVGASLRGAQVYVVAPALSNAPSRGFPQMARAHELFTRLLLARRSLSVAMAATGGELRTALYAVPIDHDGFTSRVERWRSQVQSTPFLRDLWPFAGHLADSVVAAGSAVGVPEDPSRPPLLHQKVQVLTTSEFWRRITASSEWPEFMGAYLRYRRATYSDASYDTTAAALSDSLGAIAARMLRRAQTVPTAASFALVGSQNQDYRGMFMDGEIAVLFTGAESLVPLIDLVFMFGIVTWVDDQDTLDRLLPPVGELQRRIARVVKDGV